MKTTSLVLAAAGLVAAVVGAGEFNANKERYLPCMESPGLTACVLDPLLNSSPAGEKESLPEINLNVTQKAIEKQRASWGSLFNGGMVGLTHSGVGFETKTIRLNDVSTSFDLHYGRAPSAGEEQLLGQDFAPVFVDEAKMTAPFDGKVVQIEKDIPTDGRKSADRFILVISPKEAANVQMRISHWLPTVEAGQQFKRGEMIAKPDANYFPYTDKDTIGKLTKAQQQEYFQHVYDYLPGTYLPHHTHVGVTVDGKVVPASLLFEPGALKLVKNWGFNASFLADQKALSHLSPFAAVLPQPSQDKFAKSPVENVQAPAAGTVQALTLEDKSLSLTMKTQPGQPVVALSGGTVQEVTADRVTIVDPSGLTGCKTIVDGINPKVWGPKAAIYQAMRLSFGDSISKGQRLGETTDELSVEMTCTPAKGIKVMPMTQMFPFFAKTKVGDHLKITGN